MEVGYVEDAGDHGMAVVSHWRSGAPRKAWWGGLKTKGVEKRAVSTFRCRRCGYLESYAEGSPL
jgi:hypothetical protein